MGNEETQTSEATALTEKSVAEPSVAAETTTETLTPSALKIADTAEYKGLQRTLNKFQEELARERAKNLGVEALMAKIEAQEAMLTMLVEAQSESQQLLGSEDTGAKTIKARLAEVQQKQKDEAERFKQARSVAEEYRQDITEEVQEAKLDWNDERLTAAQRLWNEGRFRESLREVKSVAKQAKKAQESDVEREVERRLKEREQAKMKVDVGSGTGGPPLFTAEQIEKMSLADFRKHKTAIEEAQRMGRIKS